MGSRERLHLCISSIGGLGVRPTGERTDGRVVNKGEDEDERSDRPRYSGLVGGTETDKTDDKQGKEDADQTRKIDGSTSKVPDQRPRDDGTDKSDGVLLSARSSVIRRQLTRPRVMLNA